MAKRKKFEPRDQIAYIPLHASGDIKHPDVELGFVTSVRDDTAFCRYWSKWEQGELRTKANSEGTPIAQLVYHVSTSQEIVDALYRALGYDD